jgi:penicillin-binding protein 1C
MQRMQSEHDWRADPLDAGYKLRPDANPPREAPHLARRLFKEQPNQDRRTSALDATKQNVIERALNDYLNRKRDMGITNACAMLVHSPTREVLAYVGSAGFLDPEIQGQVDGVIARRSPGSALKPFVYALAMQEGIIHPRSLLRDAKLSFGEYNPENFDREFAGPIPAEDALFRSRNIPAVALAQRLEEPGLYGFLRKAGVLLPKSVEFYGLSLPLGGGEVSMEELARLYAMLGDDGCVRPLVFAKSSESKTKEDEAINVPLLTPESCFLTRQMLKPREGEPQFDDDSVSWKTGTSHGFRDAWAAGIRGDYVLIVWIGNFNGKSNPAFVARECAAPLLFETFRKLRLPRKVSVPPQGVDEIELCAVSGQLPTPHCQHRMHGWFIPGVSPIAPCEIHREVLIDPTSRLRVIADDGRKDLQREVYEFWAPDLMELFRQAGLPRREPPPLEPSAKALQAAAGKEAPKISSPRHALVYTLRAKDPQRQSIPLRADTAPGVNMVYWFVGKQFLGASKPVNSLLWHANPGHWKLQVLDDHGRSASCDVRVEMVE